MIVDGASTQYGDARGTVSIDWHSGSDIHELAKDLDVPEKYFPLALKLWLGSNYLANTDTDPFFSITIYAAEKIAVGDDANKIMEYARSHGRIPVKKFDGTISVKDLSKYIKCFSVDVRSHKIIGGAELEDEGEG